MRTLVSGEDYAGLDGVGFDGGRPTGASSNVDMIEQHGSGKSLQTYL
jgi:hypothetical protein